MKKWYFLILAYLLLSPFAVVAQGEEDGVFKITKAIVNEEKRAIDLLVKARKPNGEDLLREGTEQVEAYMNVVGEKPKKVKANVTKWNEEERGLWAWKEKKVPQQVLFLMDLSGSMRGDKLVKAKKAIDDVLSSDVLKESNIEFAWFHDDIGRSKKLSKYNFKAVVDVVSTGPYGEGKDTDLYWAIKEKCDELKEKEGQRILILLTDGKNDIEDNKRYKGEKAEKPISQKEILSYVSQLDTAFLIYSVGLGKDANEQFLKGLKDATPNPDDAYEFGIAPEELPNSVMKIATKHGEPNFMVRLFPDNEDDVFGTEKRLLTLHQVDNTKKARKILRTADLQVVLGSAARRVDLSTTNNDNIYAMLTGISLIALLLVIIVFSVPIYNSFQFKRKYIKKYKEVKEEGRQPKDPLTLELYEDEDDVVVNETRDKMMKLSSWKYFKKQKKQTGEFAELFRLETSSGNFFSQRGAFKQLNWLWFGALGGLIAWVVNIVLLRLDWEWYLKILTKLDNIEAKEQISNSIFSETLVGIAMGAAIIGTLAIVEERGGFRKFSYARITLRIFIGALIGFGVFFVESTFIAKFLPYRFWGQLVGWAIFGPALGFVVSLFSSIELINGLKGGVVAGLIASLLYAVFDIPFVNEVFPSNVSAVISFICYGGVLGYTLYTIVNKLEAFELLCLSPEPFALWKSPISKWLKDPNIDYIQIGIHPKNHVYIKWHQLDPIVMSKHARLSFSMEKVYIEPDEGEVWVNNNKINGPIPLNNEDIIQFARHSVTQLQFKAKEKVSAVADIRPPKEVEQIRSQIKITRKPQF